MRFKPSSSNVNILSIYYFIFPWEHITNCRFFNGFFSESLTVIIYFSCQ